MKFLSSHAIRQLVITEVRLLRKFSARQRLLPMKPFGAKLADGNMPAERSWRESHVSDPAPGELLGTATPDAIPRERRA